MQGSMFHDIPPPPGEKTTKTTVPEYFYVCNLGGAIVAKLRKFPRD